MRAKQVRTWERVVVEELEAATQALSHGIAQLAVTGSGLVSRSFISESVSLPEMPGVLGSGGPGADHPFTKLDTHSMQDFHSCVRNFPGKEQVGGTAHRRKLIERIPSGLPGKC